jgi:hypothetical protein
MSDWLRSMAVFSLTVQIPPNPFSLPRASKIVTWKPWLMQRAADETPVKSAPMIAIFLCGRPLKDFDGFTEGPDIQAKKV